MSDMETQGDVVDYRDYRLSATESTFLAEKKGGMPATISKHIKNYSPQE